MSGPMSEHPPTPPDHGVDPSLDIQSHDLPPKVRSYVDTLRQQVRDIFQRYGITTTGFREATAQLTAHPKVSLEDLEHFRDITRVLIKIHKAGALPPEVRESRPVTATVREDALCTIPAERGREVTLNLREVLDFSLAFLESKAPPTWAVSLREAFPHGLSLTPDQRKTIETAIEYGFTHALLMPGGDTQGITTIETQKPDPNDPTKQITEPTLTSPDTLRAAMDHFLNTCSNADGAHPVPDLPDTEQYTAPFVYEPEKTKVPMLRPGAPSRSRPHLVLYGPGGNPESLKNLTCPEADAAFLALANTLQLPTLTGLTTPERLLLQRRECEERAPLTPDQRTATYGDARPHAFDAYNDTVEDSNWSWDLDSRVPGGCCRGLWDSGFRRSELDWNGASGREPVLGAHPVVVVEL